MTDRGDGHRGRADLRFLLPHEVRTATVLTPGSGWERALDDVGVESGPRERADLVVADASSAKAAIAARSRAVIVEEADATRRLRAAGYRAEALLAVPTIEAPAAFVPLHDAGAARYLLTSWLAPNSRWKLARNRLAATLLGVGVAPGRAVVTLATRDAGPPLLVRAAMDLGIPDGVRPVLLPGQGDRLARGVIKLFERGADAPSWALKFARAPGYAEQFERDARGYRVLDDAGPVARRHAPEPIGRFVCAGVHAAVETAGIGQPLIAFLHSPASRRAKLSTLERIAAWLVELATSTRDDPATLRPQLDRLAARSAAADGVADVPDDLLAQLAQVPAIATHNDLGSWNVVVSGDDFRALDWEAARRHGFPLWDLWYLLGDALAHADGMAAARERAPYLASLFRGDLDSSRLLFAWTRRMAESLRIPAEAVGPLATLCWLHHGLSGQTRQTALDEQGAGAELPHDVMAELSRRWTSDPELGPAWRRWETGGP